jgi:hypothetical protein
VDGLDQVGFDLGFPRRRGTFSRHRIPRLGH